MLIPDDAAAAHVGTPPASVKTYPFVPAAKKVVVPEPVWYGSEPFAPEARFVAVVALVAVAALPPIDKPDAVPVNPVPAPLNAVADNVPVDGTYFSFVDETFSPVIEPVVALVKVR
jgi:hypothetical protein